MVGHFLHYLAAGGGAGLLEAGRGPNGGGGVLGRCPQQGGTTSQGALSLLDFPPGFLASVSLLDWFLNCRISSPCPFSWKLRKVPVLFSAAFCPATHRLGSPWLQVWGGGASVHSLAVYLLHSVIAAGQSWVP
uniref:Uncharacterized protein n=1 Tax=Sphaerodactylus townsendi TaxID=933632 RepID=A0ACB8EP84_9SAUR